MSGFSYFSLVVKLYLFKSDSLGMYSTIILYSMTNLEVTQTIP